MRKIKNKSKESIFFESRWIATSFPIEKAHKTHTKLFRQKSTRDYRNAPIFRYEFSLDKSCITASLNICGLGYYEAWINQKRVGDHVLDPAQTDYEKRVFYVNYDVKSHLKVGKNCIGVMLGNGWFNQDRVWGKNGLSYGQPRLICELIITLSDGTSVIFGSNKSWKWSPGPIIENNIYAGEVYDARMEQDGWNAPGFDDSSWHPVNIISEPRGELILQDIPPIRKIQYLKPLKLEKISSGKYIVDMGQNFSGWAKINIKAKSGKEIVLRFSETLANDGNIDTASTGVFATKVEQIDRYIAKGNGIELWEPRFTYHGFRYIEVSGWPNDMEKDLQKDTQKDMEIDIQKDMEIEDISGVVVHTDISITGSFECSDKRLNNLHNMAVWTHRSNIHGIPEDCPARERCGWLGDANLVAEYSMWNYNGKLFWEKYINDIETTRTKNDGIPSDIAPGKRGTSTKGNPDWLATFILLPWYVYGYYGDLNVLRNHWDGMNQLMTYFKEISKNWIIKKGYGDWFDPGSESICSHTSPALTSTFWFYKCANVMKSAASAMKSTANAIKSPSDAMKSATNAMKSPADAMKSEANGLNKEEEYEKYLEWETLIKESAINEYYNPNTGSFGSQTANAMALKFGIYPEGEDPRILKALVKDINDRNIHVNTGIMGIRFIFEILTQLGYGDLALALMHQDSYPSFGNLILRGATTLWEYWGEKEHDEKHGPRSLNHPMMGGYDNWFYNTLAGINIDFNTPGFKHFYLQPYPISGIDWVKCSHICPYGTIESNWVIKDDLFEWSITIPLETHATIILPFSKDKKELSAGQYTLFDSKSG